jgi:hypothetical protein
LRFIWNMVLEFCHDFNTPVLHHSNTGHQMAPEFLALTMLNRVVSVEIGTTKGSAC